MIVTINTAYDLDREMRRCGRDYYSIPGLEWILDWYDEGDPLNECDPVAISGDWNEYGEKATLSIMDLIYDYGYLTEAGGYKKSQWETLEDDEQEAVVDELLDIINDRSIAVKLDNGDILVHVF